MLLVTYIMLWWNTLCYGDVYYVTDDVHYVMVAYIMLLVTYIMSW